jgi:dTDP-glucose pyrophosphorylase
MGSRYGGIKQIESVGPSGEAIIDYSIYDALRAGFDTVVFIIRRDIEDDFKRFVGSKFEGRIRVEYAYQELGDVPPGRQVPDDRKKPWGTAHAVLAARDVVNAPFAVINADDFYGRKAYEIMGRYLSDVSPQAPDYSMIGYILGNTLSEHGTVSRGICEITEEGYLTGITEHTKIEKQDGTVISHTEQGDVELSDHDVASMNFFGFTPVVFSQFMEEFQRFLSEADDPAKSEFFIPYALAHLIESSRARVKVLPTDSPWFGVTYRDDKPKVVSNIQDLVSAGEYPESLWR